MFIFFFCWAHVLLMKKSYCHTYCAAPCIYFNYYRCYYVCWFETQISDFANGLINSLCIAFGDDFSCNPSKVGHFFFLSGLVFSLLRKHESDTMVITNKLFIVWATEIIQYLLMVDRSFLHGVLWLIWMVRFMFLFYQNCCFQYNVRFD